MDKTNDDNGLSEQPFRMGRGDFARKMFHFWGITPLLLLCALALVGIIAGFLIDMRYSILALMVVFILMPTVMMFLYYYHGLSENCRFNIVDHNLYVEEQALRVSMYFPNPTEEDADARKQMDFFIDYNRIRSFKVFDKSVVFPIGTPVNGFVWLPLSAFDSVDDFRKALDKISAKIKKS